MGFYGIQGKFIPVDVSDDLKKLGFIPCPGLEGNYRTVLE
jgi:hypothetical protein